jgi:hypothetical protein
MVTNYLYLVIRFQYVMVNERKLFNIRFVTLGFTITGFRHAFTL